MNIAILSLLFLSLAQPPAAPAPPAAAAKTPSKEFVTAREHIADLSLLQSLVPLKLTPVQIEKIVPVLKTASDVAAKNDKEDEAGLKRILPDLTKARKEAISGTPVPAEIETQVNELRRQSDTRRAAANKNANRELLLVLREALTAEQKTEIEKQVEKAVGRKPVPQKYAAEPEKAPAEIVTDTAISLFIDRVFLFERTIALLEELKKAVPAPDSAPIP